MIVRIQKRRHPYAQIDKRPLEDSRLSWKAKGLLAYLLSRPDDWTIMIEQLVTVSTDKRIAVQSALQALSEFGYADLEQVRTENGSRAYGKRWVVREEPLTSMKPDCQETRQSEILTVRKPTPTNKEVSTENEFELMRDEFRESVTAEEIYAEYPLKVGRPIALNAIKKAMKICGGEKLKELTEAYAKARGKLPYTPHPATWFNQQRYNDDPLTWVSQSNGVKGNGSNGKGLPAGYREV